MNGRVDMGMVTTTFELPGYRVVRTLGLVRGIIVRSRSIFGNIGASLQTIVGRKYHAVHGYVRERLARTRWSC